MRRLTNAEIAKNPQYGDFSLEQSQLGVEEFYDRMDDVMSPEPLDPLRAMKEAIDSLEEQVKTRVTSVENGRKFQNGEHGDATMPDGPSIFETTGAWEDFATPARDFRLLIAIDVVRGFPDRVARQPERYAMPDGKSVADVKAELQSVLASELAARKFSYTRSDGSRVDALAQGRDRPRGGSRDGVQPERLRRAAVGRAGQERRGVDLQAACAAGAAREDDGVPHLVPRAALADARLAVSACGRHRRQATRIATTVCLVAGLVNARRRNPLLAQDDQVRSALDKLVAAYPDALAGHDGKVLRWRDGTVMPISDGADSKTFPELLRHASIIDQFRIPYPRGPLEKPPAVDADPGRFRNTAFFTKMYGDCQKGQVTPHLASHHLAAQDVGDKSIQRHVAERRR